MQEGDEQSSPNPKYWGQWEWKTVGNQWKLSQRMFWTTDLMLPPSASLLTTDNRTPSNQRLTSPGSQCHHFSVSQESYIYYLFSAFYLIPSSLTMDPFQHPHIASIFKTKFLLKIAQSFCPLLLNNFLKEEPRLAACTSSMIFILHFQILK
jgi:hypothetical protein